MSRFGRTRVQDRAADSDDIPVTEHSGNGDPRASGITAETPAAPGLTGRTDDDLTASAAALFAKGSRTQPTRTQPTFVDQRRVDPDAPAMDEPHKDQAINALRAATTAAGAHVQQPSVDDVEQIRNLHAANVDAERRSRRVLSTPGARRRFQYASTAETVALQLLGFATYDEFVAVHGAIARTDEAESDETILRIRALLTELGVDPLGDPLRAASDFLTAHESEIVEGTLDAPQLRGQAGVVRANTANADADAKTPPAKMDWSKPITPASEPVAPNPPRAEVAGTEIESAEPAPVNSFEAASPVEMKPVEPVAEPVAPAAAIESAIAESAAEPELDAPWVPAAHIPTPAPIPAPIPAPAVAAETPPPPPPKPEPDAEVVDRWIHAEARAERMHAEVDQAQAELVAMLARSADLEQTVVTRVDELDIVNAELARVQQRVEELEHSIAKSDNERVEIDRALAASRTRVDELEAMLAEREAARALADQERARSLETVAELESTLAERTSELERARASVAEVEMQLIAQAAHLDDAHGETRAARVASDALMAELEATKRSLDALDTHAEAIEAELADARRTAGSPETRRELDAVRLELTEARHELGHLELERAETDRLLALDRIELQQLQHTLATTRDQAIGALDELTAVRHTVEETRAQAEAAERVRDAVTIDAADVLARAEAEATSVIGRANRDAEAIRQESMYANGVPIDFNRPADDSDGASVRELADHVERLERKLAKQRRRLDRLSREATRDARPKASKLKPGDFRAARREPDDANAVEVLAAAEREAAEIRRAARRDRDRFREELVGLLSRLAPLASDSDADDEDDE